MRAWNTISNIIGVCSKGKKKKKKKERKKEKVGQIKKKKKEKKKEKKSDTQNSAEIGFDLGNRIDSSLFFIFYFF